MRDSRAQEHLWGYFGLWFGSWKFEIETFESERGGGEGGYSKQLATHEVDAGRDRATPA
jgi:hypothetical protein